VPDADPGAAGRYLAAGPMTGIGPFAARLDDVPADPTGIARLLHGLLIHEFLGPLYDVELGEEQRGAVHLHRADDVLALATQALGDAPLGHPLDPADRVPSNCRQFSVVATALARAKGIPARARCGFGAYFVPGRLEDHWVVEVWSETDQRWKRHDAQIDDLQRSTFGITDPVDDLPPDAFVVAGDAWLRHRAGDLDPDTCGLSVLDEAGDWWIAANLIRDVVSLLGVETRPWDVWGAMTEPGDPIPDQDRRLFDDLAVLTVGGTSGGQPTAADLDRLATLAGDPRVAVPAQVFNAGRHRLETMPVRA
jgi:hypothetical protein